MKKLFLICVSSVCICGSLAATPVLFSLQSLTGTVNNRQILVQPDKTGATPLWLNTNLVPVNDFTLQPVGGSVTTNLAAWGYTIRVDGWPRSVHIVVPQDTNTWNVVSLINTNEFSPLNIFIINATNADNASINNATGTNVDLSGGFTGALYGTATNATWAANVPASGITGTIPASQVAGVVTNAVAASGTNNAVTVSNGVVTVQFNTNPTASAGAVTNNFIMVHPNGTNDSTAALQTVLDSTNGLSLDANADYYATNLWNLSNVIEGHGARLHKIHTAANFSAGNYGSIGNTNWDALLYLGIKATGTNYLYGNNPVVHNLVLCGDYTPVTSATAYTGANHNYSVCFYNFETNRNGLICDLGAGGEVSGCLATNWNGVGFFLVNRNDQLAYGKPQAAFHDIAAGACSAGLYAYSLANSVAGYGNAEYCLIHGYNAAGCAIGADVSAANSQLENFTISGCAVPLVIGFEFGNTPAHGRIANGTMNHNSGGFFIYTGGGGEQINNVLEIFSPSSISGANANYVMSSAQFNGCVLSPVIVDNSATANTNATDSFNAGTQINGLYATNGVLNFSGCQMGAKVAATSNTITAFGNTATFAFTNWIGDVFANTGCQYRGGGNYSINGEQVLNDVYAPMILATNFTVTTLGWTNPPGLTATYPAGTYEVYYQSSSAINSGGGGYQKIWLQFTNAANTSPVNIINFDIFSDAGGTSGSGTVYHQGQLNRWSGALDYNNTIQTVGYCWGTGLVVATNNWQPSLVYAVYSGTGTNTIYGASITVKRK